MSVFRWSFFSIFSVCNDCILKPTTVWLLKVSVLYTHSFMQVHNTTFQIKTVFNNVLFSTEVHNLLHVHLLALSHIYALQSQQYADCCERVQMFGLDVCFRMYTIQHLLFTYCGLKLEYAYRLMGFWKTLPPTLIFLYCGIHLTLHVQPTFAAECASDCRVWRCENDVKCSLPLLWV